MGTIQLGDGNFGTVVRGKCRKTGKDVAIKVVPKSKQTAESIRHEVAVQQRVSLHKRIASLEAMYETDETFYIVMEFVSGGEVLESLIHNGPMSEREAATLVSELAGAVAILHAQGLAHADIKPENLLLTADGHVKLVDFGLSASFVGGERVDPNRPGADGVATGTAAYWAPEVFGNPRGPELPNDLWGLGIITYMLLMAGHPFDDDGQATDEQIRTNILDAEPNMLGWKASDEAKQFVMMLLRKDVRKRPTIEQLLQHPWIVSLGASGGTARHTQRSTDRQASAAAAEDQRRFREHTARLRAACFAVLVQQQREEAPELHRHSTSAQLGQRALQRHESMRGPMLEADMLTKAFRVFDLEGKGFISPEDLQRVLAGFGYAAGVDGGGDVSGEWMEGATDGDREGRRITYGSFVRLMGHTVKRALPAGDAIFRQGDPVTHLYCLLSGEAEVVQRTGFFSESVLSTLSAGEYFGENALLEGASARSVSVRCTTPVEVLSLAKSDFDAAFSQRTPTPSSPSSSPSSGAQSAAPPALRRQSSGAEEELRESLLTFIRMVSPQSRRTLHKGADVFSAGDASDKFHILASGRLVVHGAPAAGGAPGAAGAPDHKFGEIAAGEAFGEHALLASQAGGRAAVHSKSVTCASPTCEVVEILGADFLRLLEKSRVVRQSFERLDQKRTAQNGGGSKS